MDKILKKICGLLKSPDNMRACGAALVLAELAPKNAKVVKALGEALEDANTMFTGCILEAMDSIKSKNSAPYVMRLLDSEEMTIRLQASAIVAHAGAAVLPEIKKLFAKSGRRQKLSLIDLLARIQTRDAVKLLLEQLFDRDFDIVKQTCDSMRRHTGGASAADKLRLHKQVVQFMNSPKAKQRERVLTSCLLLIGNIGRPEARSILMKYAAPKTHPYLRRHALIGLKGLTYTTATGKTMLVKIFPYIEDPDADIARHTLDVVDRLPEASLTAVHVHKLLKSRHGYTRAFAANRLSGSDNATNNKLLVDLLRHEDHDVQEIAARTLAGHKNATKVLVDALAVEKDADAAWRFARILKPHSASIDKKMLNKFVALTAKTITGKKPTADSLMYFVRNVDQKAAGKILLDVGLQHKRAKRWQEGVDCLRRLINTELFDDKIGYALNICDLKKSHKDLAPQLRERCYALRGFRFLLRSNFNLGSSLKKDKSLTSEDLYYVGFHFREQPGTEREFGEELLRHVGKTWPRSTEGKAVKTMFKPVRAVKPAARPKKKATPKKKTKPSDPAKNKKASTKKPSKTKASSQKKKARTKKPARKKKS